ncbi:cAMP-dependent protein kinase regulatory subunit [Thraustotheca clavata]|uniref:cAMP-dependent protein kinase regulatory subunit n=1 Tax=Thraustotheca clavata TaxID=74557 RepID=A0A1V9YUB7_9STRA|nr:cAMP-dependent protein kinase regulatory subunit [Thraustotheca clavata]
MADAEGVQQELQDYLQKKGINTLFINIVESLLLSKPDNPVLHIIQYLQTNFPDQATVRAAEAPPIATGHHSDESESEDEADGEEDSVGEMQETQQAARIFPKGRRISVSAETLDPENAKPLEAVVHPKSAEERKRISDILVDNILFKSLDDKQSKILLDAMFPKEYEVGEVIIKQGDDGDNFYILDTGVCEVYKDDNLVLTCTEAMSFGELALMYNAPRAATVKVKEKAKVWALDRTTFKFIIMETTMKKRDQYKGFIEKVPLLESLSEYERLTVADALRVATFNDGEVIIRQGDDGNLFYIISEGTAVCTKQVSPSDPIQEIGVLSTGAYFGEIALLTTRPRQATVTAKGEVKCLTLDRKTFKRVMGPLENILKRNIAQYNLVMANTI